MTLKFSKNLHECHHGVMQIATYGGITNFGAKSYKYVFHWSYSLVLNGPMKFRLPKFLSERENFLLAIAQNREKLQDTIADELMIFYARLAMWMLLAGVLFVYYLIGFLDPAFSTLSGNSLMYIQFPGTIFAIWLSYRGEMAYLLYALIIFQITTVISWYFSILGSSHIVIDLNYYLILPVVAPVVVGSIIVFCLYPLQTFLANLVFFSMIVGLPFIVDPNAVGQIPAFISFFGVVLMMGVFVICISNITSVLYTSIAEKEDKQSALSQVQTVINDGLDAAPFGLLCYKDDGTLLLERGVSRYFSEQDEIGTEAQLQDHLRKKCGLNLDDVVTSSIQIQIAGKPIMVTRKPTGTTSVYSFVDMTERQEWEERALTAEKMGLVGQITSGVTHNYNNCLAVAIGGMERIPREKNEKIWEEHLDLVFDALDQARLISRKLLALSGSRDLNFEHVDIRNIVVSMQPLLASVVSDNIVVNVGSKAKITVVTDRGELEAALLNLVINARNAIGLHAGSITLETRVDGDQAVISVVDDGPGIPESVREYIFDPFFSTNRGRNASGMGLTTVKGFVESSNGAISVNSQPGRTDFELRFPLDPAKMPVLSSPVSQSEVSSETKEIEKILLVDDNLDLLDVMSDLIEYRGVSCHVAASAQEARNTMSEVEGIDAAFIDLSMPDINGIDLGVELMKKNSDCRFYLLTGERLNDNTEKATGVGFRGVFFKPMRVGELLEAAVT